MADTPIDERKFTDREVREILKRAVAKASSRALVKSEGLSLSELKAAGREVGIDPARIEDAARAVALHGGDRPRRLLGGPLVLNCERKVEGELDRDDTHEALSLIRRVMGQQGEVDEIHGSLEWSVKSDTGERYVTLSPRDGATTIRSSANLANTAVLTFIPAGFMGIVGTVVGLVEFLKNGNVFGLILFLTLLPALYTILRTIFRKVSDSESARLQRVVHELALLTEGSGE